MSTKTKRTLRAIGLWTITIGMAGLFGFGGFNKLMWNDPFPAAYEHWGYPLWFLFVVGSIELFGGIALLIPRVASLAALALGGTMAAAVTTHVVNAEWSGIPLPALLFGLLVIVGHARRHHVIDRFGIKRLVHDRA